MPAIHNQLRPSKVTSLTLVPFRLGSSALTLVHRIAVEIECAVRFRNRARFRVFEARVRHLSIPQWQQSRRGLCYALSS